MSVFATSGLDRPVANMASAASIGFTSERAVTRPIPAVPISVHSATTLTYHGSKVETARLTPKAVSASPSVSGTNPVVRNVTSEPPGSATTSRVARLRRKPTPATASPPYLTCCSRPADGNIPNVARTTT
ncbi:hypothetical protein BRD09_04780 [Halobacteriales archaeon SW_10_68_16]|nr:MAG: hypothetical protein BRD09_04780 [Halobacteriales archaeon SW_10_68_16]